MFKDFKAFLMRGNVLDLAVAVIIGAAFGKVITALTDDVIMPVIGKVFGGLDFSSKFILLGDIPAGYTGSPTDYAALKKAGVPLLGYGEFISQVVGFVIVAFVIFLFVRAASRTMPKAEEPAPSDPVDVVLLREIRDELRSRRA